MKLQWKILLIGLLLPLLAVSAYAFLPWRPLLPKAPAIPFRLFSPLKAEKGKRYPLVIFLHGAGERGTDNTSQMRNGAWNFASDEALRANPAFVLVPQCPVNGKWADVQWSATAHTLSPKVTSPMAAVMHLIDSLQRTQPIDTNRIYVTGLSMGGFGSWEMLQRYPWRFAAVVPVCGGGDTSAVNAACAKVPVWAFHGAVDPVVTVNRSREMVAALKAKGGSPRYTEYAEVGHAAWLNAYADTALLPWLFAQRKGR